MIASLIFDEVYDDLDESYSDLTSHNFDEIIFIMTDIKTWYQSLYSGNHMTIWTPYKPLNGVTTVINVKNYDLIQIVNFRPQFCIAF